MKLFSSIVTPQSLTFTSTTGRMHTITSAHTQYEALRETLKQATHAYREGDEEAFAALHRKLDDLAEPARMILSASDGRVIVKDGIVFYAGEPVHNAITERILTGLREGYDMGSYVAFLENLMENPSKRAVTELYGFLEANKMGITLDGHIIAYKRVREDYRDIHSGKVDHSIGQKPSMPRNQVDDDKDRTCSTGYHFCAMQYLPHFGTGPGNRIVIVKVNPRDVVSIPADYDHAKARCCTYEVIGEYTGSDKEDILATKAVWSDDDWRDDDWRDDEPEDAEDGLNGSYRDDVSFNLAWGFPDVILADTKIERLTYTRDGNGATIQIDIRWSNGEETRADNQDEFDAIETVLTAQAARGIKPKVRFATNG